MGAIHHAMGKHNMACHYFQKALKEDIAIASANQKENGKYSKKFSRKCSVISFKTFVWKKYTKIEINKIKK